MNRLRSGFVWVGLVLLAATPLLASGFQINEQGARAMGQAMAFAARASDPSAIYFNPAGITQLEGTHFYSGATFIKGSTTWTGEGGSPEIESRDRWEFPPSVYLTHQFNEDWYFGFGFFVPYGLSKAWPDDFPGKYTSKEVRMLNFNFNPNIAYKVNNRVSVAVGLDIIHTEARLDRDLNLQALSNVIFGGYPIDEGYFSAIVKGNGFGWNAGIQVKMTDDIFFGASYRSQVKVDLDGDLELTIPVTGVPTIDATLTALFPNQEVGTSITLPDTVFVGVGGKVSDKYETEVDLQWTNWSDYDELPFHFSQPTQVLRDVVYPKNWGNSWALRWGNEYHYNENNDLRFGMYYDWNPVPDASLDPLLPDSDRFSFQVGYGWHKDKLYLDVAYMYLYFLNREVNNNPALEIMPNDGSYESSAHLFGISAGMRF